MALRVCVSALFGMCLLSGAARACPVCVGSTPYEAGLYWSVLFLLPVPFAVMWALAVWIKKNS